MPAPAAKKGANLPTGMKVVIVAMMAADMNISIISRV